MNSSAPRAGFTLIEILTVLVLLGILAGLAAPSLHRTTTQARMRGTLDRLVADLYYARMLAVNSGDRVDVVLEEENGCIVSYTVRSRATLDAARTVSITDDLPGLCMSHNSTAADILTFNTRGMLRTGGQTISISHDGVTYEAVISFIGRVRRNY
jgi:type IV fimbrial biogenesis protein FimT